MKFRTEKNQTTNEYDEYLAYDESQDTAEADSIYGESDESYSADHIFDEADYQENYRNYNNDLEETSFLSSEQTKQQHAHLDGSELQDYRYLDNLERDDALGTTPNPIYEDNQAEEFPSRQAYLQSQQLQKPELKMFQATNDDSTEQGQIRRAKYSAKVDRFLTNGIIVVGVLLVIVLLIAFLV